MQRCDTKEQVIVEYDELAPCLICGNPVITASMGGLDICPNCDCGYFRNGKKISDDPHAIVYLVKHYAGIKDLIIPHVPTFQEVNNVATMLEARGTHLLVWELCKKYLELLPQLDMDLIKKQLSIEVKEGEISKAEMEKVLSGEVKG